MPRPAPTTRAISKAPAPWPRRSRTAAQAGLEEGFRSGLEEKVAAQLAAAGIPSDYESVTVEYHKPAKKARYTPDFPLPNGIIVETKGRFVTADRQKHLLVQAQHPHLDIRFVFSNPNARISKTSQTTYAMWCEKHGFQFAAKLIPPAWLKEPPRANRLAELRALQRKKA